jgi:hypothetical protein
MEVENVRSKNYRGIIRCVGESTLERGRREGRGSTPFHETPLGEAGQERSKPGSVETGVAHNTSIILFFLPLPSNTSVIDSNAYIVCGMQAGEEGGGGGRRDVCEKQGLSSRDRWAT